MLMYSATLLPDLNYLTLAEHFDSRVEAALALKLNQKVASCGHPRVALHRLNPPQGLLQVVGRLSVSSHSNRPGSEQSKAQ